MNFSQKTKTCVSHIVLFPCVLLLWYNHEKVCHLALRIQLIFSFSDLLGIALSPHTHLLNNVTNLGSLKGTRMLLSTQSLQTWCGAMYSTREHLRHGYTVILQSNIVLQPHIKTWKKIYASFVFFLDYLPNARTFDVWLDGRGIDFNEAISCIS